MVTPPPPPEPDYGLSVALRHRLAQSYDVIAVWEPRPMPPDWTPDP